MIEIIKQAAVEAVAASNPTGIVFGKVMSVAPLSINVEQRLTLTADHLILTSLVSNFNVTMTVNHSTGANTTIDTSHTHPTVSEGSFDPTHTHPYSGTKDFTVNLGLLVGETVILLQVQGGQKYIVLDRMR